MPTTKELLFSDPKIAEIGLNKSNVEYAANLVNINM